MRSTFRLLSPAGSASRIDRLIPALRATPLDIASWRRATALLMCGDFAPVRALLAGAPPHEALPLIAARYHAWTGDLELVVSVFERIRQSLDAVARAAAELQGLTWAELQRTATDVGDPGLSADLLRRARDRPAPAAAGAGDGPAVALIRELEDLLGPEPDAHRGRLRLRPRIGNHDEIRVHDLRFGDGAVSLSARREGSRIEYAVVQEAGAIPITLLLEPIVGSGVAGAEVDGREAELDARPHAGGILVPVQLVLDDERRLVLELEPAE